MKKTDGVCQEQLDVSSSKQVNGLQTQPPAFDLQQFFSGNLRAYGCIHNRQGKVVSQFVIDMHASWENSIGTLHESYVFMPSGKSEQRTWTIHKVDDHQYEASAEDMVGIASGTSSGNAMNWRYRLKVPFRKNSVVLHFDDWMWHIAEGKVINRSTMTKWGIRVAELTAFIEKISLTSKE